MRSVSLRSALVPDDILVKVGRAAAEDGFYLSVDNNRTGSRTGLTLSYPAARELCDFLNKELGEYAHPGQAIEPNKPTKPPQLILAWQHPENGRRFRPVSNEVEATNGAVNLKRGLPDFPIWLAQITKQYVQPNPTYEWKDI